jgi:lactoylglutathione lyase
MRYAATILYVPDVIATVEFYERAFGLERGFVADGGSYATLNGDGGMLAFATYDVAPETEGTRDRPAGFEVWLEAEDVPDAYGRAVDAGAAPVQEPVTKPWGQVVAYVRDPNGTLVELGEPVAG